MYGRRCQIRQFLDAERLERAEERQTPMLRIRQVSTHCSRSGRPNRRRRGHPHTCITSPLMSANEMPHLQSGRRVTTKSGYSGLLLHNGHWPNRSLHTGRSAKKSSSAGGRLLSSGSCRSPQSASGNLNTLAVSGRLALPATCPKTLPPFKSLTAIRHNPAIHGSGRMKRSMIYFTNKRLVSLIHKMTWAPSLGHFFKDERVCN